MEIKYSWYYGMWKINVWTGDKTPDAPSIPDLNKFDSDSSESNLSFNAYNSDITESFIGFGVHLQSALYEDIKLREVLRVFQFSELEADYPACTKIQLN